MLPLLTTDNTHTCVNFKKYMAMVKRKRNNYWHLFVMVNKIWVHHSTPKDKEQPRRKIPWVRIRIACASTIIARCSTQRVFAISKYEKKQGKKKFGTNDEVIAQTYTYFKGLEQSYFLEGVERRRKVAKCVELKKKFHT